VQVFDGDSAICEPQTQSTNNKRIDEKAVGGYVFHHIGIQDPKSGVLKPQIYIAAW